MWDLTRWHENNAKTTKIGVEPWIMGVAEFKRMEQFHKT